MHSCRTSQPLHVMIHDAGAMRHAELPNPAKSPPFSDLGTVGRQRSQWSMAVENLLHTAVYRSLDPTVPPSTVAIGALFGSPSF
jgi:hypothetical protein